MTASEDIISVSGLVKHFNGVQALADVHLEVAPGVFGLIGPNGAGKTTLLRVLLGLIRPDKGQAKVLGLDISSQSLQIRQRVGVLHEKPTYPPFMRVDDYLKMVTELYGSAKTTQKILDLVGLSDVGGRLIRTLSAGMNQRLGIAQSLAGNPELVFMDEPTSNLDVIGRDEIIKLLVELYHETGVSFFISSHNLSQLEKLCHNIAFIDAGRVIEKGPTGQIIDKHTSGLYNVVCSDPKSLIHAFEGNPDILVVGTSGIDAVTLCVKNLDSKSAREQIYHTAAQHDIELRTFTKANTLEDAYREVIRNA